MIEVKAPNAYSQHQNLTKIFLAGSIEMGVAENWQDTVTTALSDIENLLILNPRRPQWDSSWRQDIHDPHFRQQVEWELDALDAADFILVYYDPQTKSPITLMELGLHAGTNPEALIVCCPQKFWRKGNVDIVCARYHIQQVSTLEELIEAARTKVSS